MSQSQGTQIRKAILDHYYHNIYSKYLFESTGQSKGIDYFEKFVEKCWPETESKNVGKILEIGAGQGEHWPYLKNLIFEQYFALDLRPMSDLSYLNRMPDEFKEKLHVVTGDAESMPFASEFFDRVYSTCLLHHVNEPLDVLLEARRVAKVDGEILFVMPTDPGFANQLVKRFVSYRKLKKLTKYDPSLFYALEHRNHVNGLLSLIKFVFKEDHVKFVYSPLGVKSWNLNLIVGVYVKKSSVLPNYLTEELQTK